MSTNKSKLAVIGLGNIGKVVASNLVKGNREVTIASHKIDEAKEFASQLGSLAIAAEVKTAIKEADIVILSVWFSTIQELLKNTQPNFKVRSLLIHQIQLHQTAMADLRKSSALTSQPARFSRDSFQVVQNLSKHLVLLVRAHWPERHSKARAKYCSMLPMIRA